jgi:hypothetical protein
MKEKGDKRLELIDAINLIERVCLVSSVVLKYHYIEKIPESLLGLLLFWKSHMTKLRVQEV